MFCHLSVVEVGVNIVGHTLPPDSPVYGILVALVHERLAGQGVRGVRSMRGGGGRRVVHGRQVRVRQPVLMVHRAALHVAPAVEALVVL